MFRFTIRELVLVTLVVAMGVGWWIHERQLRTERLRVVAWRQRAGALEHFLRADGWKVTWQESGSVVTAFWPREGFGKGDRDYYGARMSVCTNFHEPSLKDPP